MFPAKPDLDRFRTADLLACTPGELTDLRDVRIDPSLPLPQRLEGFTEQVGNPYLFQVDGLIVKATYLPGANRPLSDALPGLLIP